MFKLLMHQVTIAAMLVVAPVATADVDPLATNNGLFPTAAEWSGSFREANLDYPQQPVGSSWASGADGRAISVGTAPAYMARLKSYLAPTLRGLIETPHDWRPAAHGWYDMVWQGDGSSGPDGVTDPTSGREALLNSYTGQIVPASSWSRAHQPSVMWVQNHAVIYYNDVAAAMLGRLWKDLYGPDISQVTFPEGSVVIKVEAVTPTPAEWDLVKDAAVWNVYRPAPPTDPNPNKSPGAAESGADAMNFDPIAAEASIAASKAAGPKVLEVRAFQMSVAIKDTVASPQTGWVYGAFVYDAEAADQGDGPWDRFVALGAMWGNDPELTDDPRGLPRGEQLAETWINPASPRFTRDTLGWGGRLAGPMDVATRHEVITTDGKRYSGAEHLRASSCLSCHGSAEFPFTTNLYPSPNKKFPKDGAATDPFLLYTPGSQEWARWFQNRSGSAGNTGAGDARIPGLDYDMVIMFALSSFNRAMGNDGFVFREFHGH